MPWLKLIIILGQYLDSFGMKLSRQLSGEDWILHFYGSISRQFQCPDDESPCRFQAGGSGPGQYRTDSRTADGLYTGRVQRNRNRSGPGTVSE